MSHTNPRYIFGKRPLTVTVALALSTLTALAILNQGVATLFRLSMINIGFESISRVSRDHTSVGLVSIFWALLQIYACYRATFPNQIARFGVIGLCGVNTVLIMNSRSNGVSPWYVALLLLIFSLPVVLLLLPSSNDYYAE
jgi:hypothetical protein